MKTMPLAFALAAFALAACGPKPILGKGSWVPSVYKPRDHEARVLRVGGIEIYIDKLAAGARRTDFQVHMEVTNIGDAPVAFEPGEVLVYSPEHDLTYEPDREGKVLGPGTLQPGASVSGKNKYETAGGDARVYRLVVRYRGEQLFFGHLDD